jgi:hypothetical protein
MQRREEALKIRSEEEKEKRKIRRHCTWKRNIEGNN